MTTLAELILRADYRQIDGANTALDNMSDTGQKATNTLKNLAATLGVAFGVREVLQAAEAYTNITNKLKLVTDSSEELAAAQEQLFAISQETRQPLAATSELYQKLAQNADTLGLSLNEVGKTTETINKLITLSGSSADAANAAIIQLSQGLASGALRGDELNSVMEQTPALAKAIAEGMGITIGQLRAMGAEGKITAEAIIAALNKQGEAVDAQFAKMAPTMSQATTQIENSFTRLVGKIDQTSGASQGLASALSGISEFLDTTALETASRLFGTWGASFDNASRAADGLGGKFDEISTGAKAITWFVSNALIELPSNVKAIVGITTTYIAAFIDDTSNRFERAKDRWNAIWTSSTWADAEKAYQARAKSIQGAKEDSIAAIMAERDAEIEAGNAKAAAAAKGADMGALDAKGKPTASGKAVDAAAEEKRRKEAERAAKWLEEQKIYWSNEIVAEMDKIASQSEMENKAYADKLLRLQQQFGTESELEQVAYAKKLEDYAAYAEMIGLSEEAQRQQREKFEQDHVDRMLAIRTKDLQNDKSGMAARLGATHKFLNDMYAATGANSQRTLKLIQSVGAAQALANAYIAASQALADPSVPFFAKFAAVAQVLATGMGLVNAIKGGSQSASTGGSASAASSADTSGIQAQQPARAQTVDFRIERRGNRGWDDEDVAELMMAIGERVKDGAKFGRVEFVVT